MWSVVGRLERDPLLTEATPEQIEKARRRRQRLIRLPAAWLFVGRPHGGVHAQDDVAQLADGTELPVRVYRPKGSSGVLPVVVSYHGGGFMTGDARQSEWWSSNVAARAGAVVVAIDYRLAPTHRFPVAAEDAYAGLCWVVENAAVLGVDADRLAVMGDSAGGNLSAVVSMLARDRSGPKIRLQVLLYPVVDMVGQYPSEAENAVAPVLSKRDMDRFHGVYLGGGDASDVRASPLLADHAGLPPAVIETAQFDPLRDQGIAYADALRAAGVPVQHTNRPNAVHGFISVPGLDPSAHDALRDVVRALRDALDGAAG
jgi:acetyl esterase